MDIFLQQIINGLTLGSVYALVALGYTMVYGIIGLLNFAHGEVMMIGALVSLTVTSALASMGIGLPPFAMVIAGVLVAIPVCVFVSCIAERVAYRPLRKASRLAPLITAIGVSLLLQHFALLIWGRDHMSYPMQLVEIVPYAVGGGTITNVQMAIILSAALIMVGLLVLVHKTRLGIAMRATSQNQVVATLMGININTTIVAAFVIGAALAAVAGQMVAMYYGVAHYHMGFLFGLKAFTAAVLGGIGNIAGAMVGGVLLGVIEALGAGYSGDLTGGVLGSHYQDVFAFFVLILVLLFKPSGIMGERVGDRA